MAVEHFLREVWSAKIQMGLDLEANLVSHCTKEYEGDAKYAKTVRILAVGEPTIDGYHGTVDYEDMDDEKQNLDIDIQEFFSFKVDDVDKSQSMPGLDTAYQKRAVKRLAQRREVYVGRLVAGKLLNTADEAKATYSKTTDTTLIPYKDYYIKDTNNKTIKINYDSNNKITKVIDASNKEINITYTNNKISFISPYKTTIVNLTDNKITSIENLGDTTSIYYNSYNLIEKITNSNGLSTKYEYLNDLTYKVSKITEYSNEGNEGNYLEFTYNV